MAKSPVKTTTPQEFKKFREAHKKKIFLLLEEEKNRIDKKRKELLKRSLERQKEFEKNISDLKNKNPAETKVRVRKVLPKPKKQK